ncbi:4Fe-4S binding protein [Candidatus Omnitrophota bacterium]
MKKIIFLRRFSQIISFLLFVYILWSTTYPLEGILPAETFFTFNPLLMVFLSISERVALPGLLSALIMIGLTICLGRFFCGWVCPLGTLIDCAGVCKGKHNTENYSVNKKVRGIKYYIFAIGLIWAVCGVQIIWLFDPMVIMGRFVSLNLIPFTTMIVNNTFIFFIQKMKLYGFFYDMYRALKTSFLGVQVYFFSNALIIFIFLIVILMLVMLKKRLWCRMICPLGALYAIVSRFTLMRREVSEKCIHCHNCSNACRMGAIHEDIYYEAGECIMCMDCIDVCPSDETRFTWKSQQRQITVVMDKKGSISRRHFLCMLGSSIIVAGTALVYKGLIKGKWSAVIRPPGALKEQDFLNRCIRCGNCMKVCITNGLQPTLLESGIQGLWTPQLVPEIGYCEHNCNLCSDVCPTGAIKKLSLEKKKQVRLGRAEIDRTRCVAWAQNMECLVCEEHCPIPNKAIKTIRDTEDDGLVLKPVVDSVLCVGCGICQTNCPAEPKRAITVNPQFADRF